MRQELRFNKQSLNLSALSLDELKRLEDVALKKMDINLFLMINDEILKRNGYEILDDDIKFELEEIDWT